MRFLFYLLCLIIIYKPLSANGVDNLSGARADGLGGAGTALNDFGTAGQNTVAFAFVKHVAAAITIQNAYFISGLSSYSIAMACPFKKVGSFGFQANYFGYVLFNQTKLGLAYAKSFGENLSAAMQFNYLQTSIGDGYGSGDAITIEGGLQYKITKKLTLGLHLYNPLKSKISNLNIEALPVLFQMGIAFNFSQKGLIVLETEKDIAFKAIFKTGVEYELLKSFSLRLGLSHQPAASPGTNYSVASFGFGLKIKQVNLDMASAWHSVLGFKPKITLCYKF
jgi:hypothetical protein